MTPVGSSAEDNDSTRLAFGGSIDAPRRRLTTALSDRRVNFSRGVEAADSNRAISPFIGRSASAIGSENARDLCATELRARAKALSGQARVRELRPVRHLATHDSAQPRRKLDVRVRRRKHDLGDHERAV